MSTDPTRSIDSYDQALDPRDPPHHEAQSSRMVDGWEVNADGLRLVSKANMLRALEESGATEAHAVIAGLDDSRARPTLDRELALLALVGFARRYADEERKAKAACDRLGANVRAWQGTTVSDLALALGLSEEFAAKLR